jgi:phage antirepressor YoqD-like protein
MNDLIIVTNGNAHITTLSLAEGTENEHRAVIQLVRKYQSDLEEFGPLAFEMRMVNRNQGGGQSLEYAFLNSDQATLIMTYMRNTAIVRAFKIKLVKAFSALLKQTTDHHIPMGYGEALQLAATTQLEVERLEIEKRQHLAILAEQEPKVDAYETLIGADGLYGMREASLVLHVGSITLFRVLREKCVLLGNKLGAGHPNWNTPASGYTGYFESKVKVIPHNNKKTNVTFVTPNGIVWLVKKLKEWGIKPKTDTPTTQKQITKELELIALIEKMRNRLQKN